MSFELPFFIIIGIAALAALFFSAFWYSPKILGNRWMALNGMKQTGECPDCKKEMLTTFVGYYAMAATLFIVLFWAHATTAKAGMVVGFWLGLGITGISLLIPYLWERRPLQLFAITAGNLIFSIILMCAIMSHLIGLSFAG